VGARRVRRDGAVEFNEKSEPTHRRTTVKATARMTLSRGVRVAAARVGETLSAVQRLQQEEPAALFACASTRWTAGTS